ncbi:hypothetical protein ACFQ3L_06945 [Lacticaseibacillus jixianensis]|uniref:Uncharacterized protein n=1 Tax=Lacticaseibacillus jixianensis TaxID=2486012 RepID=A0ABW4BCQ6_9LACO|nr:hypothetical protein [Lacticaseibacillus jixianensis]
MYTLDSAMAFDAAVKKVSRRLFVKYWPAYRDVQGHLELPKVSLCLENPDDPDQAEVIYDRMPPNLFEEPKTYLMDKAHQQALHAAIKAFKGEPIAQFISPSDVKSEKGCQPLRIDTMMKDGDVISVRPGIADHVIAAHETVTWEALTAYLRDSVLSALWYRTLTSGRLVPPYRSVNQADSFIMLSTECEQAFNEFFDDHSVIRTQDYNVATQAVAKGSRQHLLSQLTQPGFPGSFMKTSPGGMVIAAGRPTLKAKHGDGGVYIVREALSARATVVRRYRVFLVGAPAMAEEWGLPRQLRLDGYGYQVDDQGDFVISGRREDRAGTGFAEPDPQPVPKL